MSLLFGTYLVFSAAGCSGNDSATANGLATVSAIVVPQNIAIAVGDTARIPVAVQDAAGHPLTAPDLTWASSDTVIATVSASGVVTALSIGATDIRASASGRTATTRVAVPSTKIVLTSIGITPALPTVAVGAFTTLVASPKDAAGNAIVGTVITWYSVTPSVATVNPVTGVVTGVAAGTSVLVASNGAVNGSVLLTVTAVNAPVTPPTTPPPTTPAPLPTVGTAPEPSATDAVIATDNFDSYNGVYSTDAAPQLRANFIPNDAVSMVADGHGGSGKAVRFTYTSIQNNSIEKYFPAQTDFYVRYWYRISPGADPTFAGFNPSGFKWFMTWRQSGPRYTHGVSNLAGGPSAVTNTGLEFSTHDNSSVRQPDPFLQNKSKKYRFGNTNDGQWHKYTIHVVTGPSGYVQIWVDGELLLDDTGYGYDHSAEGIYMIQWPGTVVRWPAGGAGWTIDVDDLAIWKTH